MALAFPSDNGSTERGKPAEPHQFAPRGPVIMPTKKAPTKHEDDESSEIIIKGPKLKWVWPAVVGTAMTLLATGTSVVYSDMKAGIRTVWSEGGQPAVTRWADAQVKLVDVLTAQQQRAERIERRLDEIAADSQQSAEAYRKIGQLLDTITKTSEIIVRKLESNM